MSRLNIVDIRKEIEDQGWKLISEEYKNLDTELELKCSKGHIVFLSLKKFRRKIVCPTCNEGGLQGILSDATPEKKAKNTIRVLALDDATSTTGWAIFDNEKLISYGHFTIDKENAIERISIMRQWLLNMIIKWEPDKIGVEDIQLQKFRDGNGGDRYAVTTYKVLAQLQGVILEALFSNKKDALVIHSQTWKAYCKITAKSRNDQKRSAQLKIKDWYGLNVTQDEADAICMGKFLSEKYIRNNEMVSWE